MEKDWDSKGKFNCKPGCFATATLLAIAPLVRSGMIEEDSIIIDAKSGVSGAGKTPTTMTHFLSYMITCTFIK